MSKVEQYKSKAEKGDTDAMFHYVNILKDKYIDLSDSNI